jgi:uncharacterized protein YndB with AHSA1/START domain
MTDLTAVRVERTYRAPAQAVFDAWTDPEVMRRWFHAGDETWENAVAEADLRLGGELRVVMRAGDGTTYGARGSYTAIEPPDLLAFTWAWDDDPPGTATQIELRFSETDGATTVVLTHAGLAEGSRAGHEDGWREALANLDAALEG